MTHSSLYTLDIVFNLFQLYFYKKLRNASRSFFLVCSVRMDASPPLPPNTHSYTHVECFTNIYFMLVINAPHTLHPPLLSLHTGAPLLYSGPAGCSICWPLVSHLASPNKYKAKDHWMNFASLKLARMM